MLQIAGFITGSWARCGAVRRRAPEAANVQQTVVNAVNAPPERCWGTRSGPRRSAPAPPQSPFGFGPFISLVAIPRWPCHSTIRPSAHPLRSSNDDAQRVV